LTPRVSSIAKLAWVAGSAHIISFIVDSTRIRAVQCIPQSRHFEMRSNDWQKFSKALERPARVKPRLKKLFSESTVLELN
jgi:uncharacterized protein (DUF1778 family)